MSSENLPTGTPILIAYDGSVDAQAAIVHVAGLLPGATAVVLYARQPFESVAAHVQGHPALEELRKLDATTHDASAQVAADGARFASEAGLAAEPRVSSTMTTASEAIIAAAEDIDASLIVMGSRGRRGMRATLLGSTSTNVLHHTSRPTLVIPSGEVARARRQHLAAQ